MAEYWEFVTLGKCVTELVLNSLKANSTSVAVRIDSSYRRIQVVDDGSGIPQNSLRDVGENSTDPPARNSDDHEMICAAPLRENFLNIRRISTAMIITTRTEASAGTCAKFFSKNRAPRITLTAHRASVGTTVTIYASEKFCSWGGKADLLEVCDTMIYLALVNSEVSFSVKDDAAGRIPLRIGKRQKREELLAFLFKQPVESAQIHRLKIRVSKTAKILCYWGYECSESRKIHKILLNLRPVRSPDVEISLIENLTKICRSQAERNTINSEKIFYLLYFDCSNPDEYSCCVKNGEWTVEFDGLNRIVRCISKSLRKDFPESFKPTKTSFNQSIILPFICRPIGRALGVKRKKSFFPEVTGQSFWAMRFPAVEESRLKKIRRETSERGSRIEVRDAPMPIGNSGLIITEEEPGHDNSPEGGREEKSSRTSCTPISQRISPVTSPDAEIPKLNELDLSAASECIEAPSVKEYRYENHGVSWISQKCAEKLTNSVEEIRDIIDCSQWSDWIFEDDAKMRDDVQRAEGARPKIYKRFRFLPLKLHALLPFGSAKLISRAPLGNDGIIGEKFDLDFKYRRQDLDVRPCNRRSVEIRLKIESLQSMKVLNQVNYEFIVALTQQDGKKLLVIIDQHAMDERIRYENLLRAYRRDQKNNRFAALTLHRPIIISDFSQSACEMLAANSPLLARYGLSIAIRNDSTVLIVAVPRCFSKKSYRADNTELEIVVRKLLREVLDNLHCNGIAKFLPFTIHDAIASEACHGAIKFGDPLTVKQCESLVSCWQETEAPNRCAHGRPSVIPLLQLSTLKSDRRRIASQGKKLNFASLRNF